MATVKEITHDSSTTIGDFYDTVTDNDSAITVSPGNALDGTINGVGFDYDAGTDMADLTEAYADIATTTLRARFYLDVAGLIGSAASANMFKLSLISDNPGTSDIVVQFVLSLNGDNTGTLDCEGYDDAGGVDASIASLDLTVEHCAEVAMVRETANGNADGTMEFFIDGVSQGTASNIENFDIWDAGIDALFIEYISSDAGIVGNLKYDEFILDNDNTANLGCNIGGLTLAAMTKPLGIDASDTFIYVALLNSSKPILSKFAIALSANGTTVFNPGGGDNIGVQCGRFDADVVWVAGNFDSTNVVEKSDDAGTTFVVKDNATIGNVKSFVVGPDSDNRVLIFDETNGDILETVNNGATWTTINASVTPEVAAMARLGINVQETVFGNDSAANNNADYSVNTGADLEDTSFPVQADITSVIVN